MPWFIVKQPNGTYARFSTVVDDFTHMNMTRDEALETCRWDLGHDDGEKKVQRGEREEECSYTDPGEAGKPLSRWRGCIGTMRVLHKEAEADEREGADLEWGGGRGGAR